MNTEKEILVKLEKYNVAYRDGTPLVSDEIYDILIEELRDINPSHKFLHSVEVENSNGRKEVVHAEPMLSTKKFYIGKGSMENWINSIKKGYEDLGLEPMIRVTAKLDGLAGFDSGECLATRGNGVKGFDITRIFDLGVVPKGGRGLGVGEIVIQKEYFDVNVAKDMSHPRNMVAGIVGTDKNLNPIAKNALDNGAVEFVPYCELEAVLVPCDELEARAEELLQYFADNTNYYIDGVVAEAHSREVYEYMGYTGHHRRSQIAIKKMGDTKQVEVTGIDWQVGRTRITPVINIKPVELSGAMVSKISGHHAGNITANEIGVGAIGLAVRSGEVIPMWVNTVKGSDRIAVPTNCPSCNELVHYDGDFICCANMSCAGKVESNIRHFIKQMEILLFGEQTIKKLVMNGVQKPSDLWGLTHGQLTGWGFGDKQSSNLIQSLETRKNNEIEDNRFVASWGIENLGKGDSRKILGEMSIEALIACSVDDISNIYGFANKSANAIVANIDKNKTEINKLVSLGFNIKNSITKDEQKQLKLFGKKIVFTGKLDMPRKKLEEIARENGADIQSGVNKKTDLLIAGEKSGSKLEKAKKLGTKVLNEPGFFELIGI